MKILIVDDEYEFLEFLKERLLLFDAKLDIETALSIKEAIAKLKENHLDCIISDFLFPNNEANGIELLKFVRESETHKCMPFIFLTGKGSEIVAAKALKEKADDYFIKSAEGQDFENLFKSITFNIEKCRHIRQRQQLEKERNNFLSCITHDLRTPLVAILGYTELLLEEKLTDEQLEMVQGIYESGKTELQLVEEIIELSKCSQKLVKIEKEVFNAYDLIRKVAQYSQIIVKKTVFELYRSQSYEYRIEIDEQLKEHNVEADYNRVRRITENILSNAVKFSKPNSLSFKFKAYPKDNAIHVAIFDSGIGIDKDEQENIFDPLYQCRLDDIVFKNNFQGIGQGLTIAKEYVQLHGGKIWVESEKGQGSIFYFTIPFIAKD